MRSLNASKMYCEYINAHRHDIAVIIYSTRISAHPKLNLSEAFSVLIEYIVSSRRLIISNYK